jgi:hypothetical protein
MERRVILKFIETEVSKGCRGYSFTVCVLNTAVEAFFIGHLPDGSEVPRLLHVAMQPPAQRAGVARTTPVTTITLYYRDHGWSYSVSSSNLHLKLLRQ